jgi:hypothetical protein
MQKHTSPEQIAPLTSTEVLRSPRLALVASRAKLLRALFRAREAAIDMGNTAVWADTESVTESHYTSASVSYELAALVSAVIDLDVHQVPELRKVKRSRRTTGSNVLPLERAA